MGAKPVDSTYPETVHRLYKGHRISKEVSEKFLDDYNDALDQALEQHKQEIIEAVEVENERSNTDKIKDAITAIVITLLTKSGYDNQEVIADFTYSVLGNLF